MSDDGLTAPTRSALLTRLAIGLAQGISLYLLSRWAKDLIPSARGALALTLLFVPVIALGTLWAARRRTAILWIAGATVLSAALGAYAGFMSPPEYARQSVSFEVGFFVAATLFILHHLILPADAEGRWRATYERYFDDGWKDAVRLALAGLFVGILWAVLWLGAALFKQIGLYFLQELIEKRWFSYPATATFFALAVHLTDVRIGLVRGARTLLLTLLSWLLPLLTLITVGFLAALPFTGLKPLLAAQSTTGTLIAACAALVILINAAYQDGDHAGFPPFALKWATRIAAVALVPLTVVAIVGLSLRIGQYGLSVQRIHAVGCLVVGACYAAGYAWAAISRGRWMARLEATNWITAHVAAVVLIAIFSPVLDPARLSVDSQVARLRSGAVPPSKFDFAFLRFESGRWGTAMLKRLASDTSSPARTTIASLARAELAKKNRWEPKALTPVERAATLRVVGAALPPSFLSQAWRPEEDPAANCPTGAQLPRTCFATTIDIDDRPGDEVIVFGIYGPIVFGVQDGRWRQIGSLEPVDCRGWPSFKEAAPAKLLAPELRRNLDIAGHRLAFVPRPNCSSKTAAIVGSYSDEVTDVAIVKPVPPPPPRSQ